METARHIGLHLGIEARRLPSREDCASIGVRRHFCHSPSFQENIRRFFESPDSIMYGSESSSDVAERIESEVRRALAEYPDGNILMVTHGTAMTSFASRHTDADAYSLWQSLDLPAYIAFGLPSFDIVDSVGTALDEAAAGR